MRLCNSVPPSKMKRLALKIASRTTLEGLNFWPRHVHILHFFTCFKYWIISWFLLFFVEKKQFISVQNHFVWLDPSVFCFICFTLKFGNTSWTSAPVEATASCLRPYKASRRGSVDLVALAKGGVWCWISSNIQMQIEAATMGRDISGKTFVRDRWS